MTNNQYDFSPLYAQTLAQYVWRPIRCAHKGCLTKEVIYAWPEDKVLCRYHFKQAKHKKQRHHQKNNI